MEVMEIAESLDETTVKRLEHDATRESGGDYIRQPGGPAPAGPGDEDAFPDI
jgi:hypothetical protein